MNNERHALVIQLLGGETGQVVEQDLAKKGVDQITIRSKAPTRTCTTLLCQATDETTEVIEPSGEIMAEELNDLMDRLEKLLSTVDAVAICGTFPPGISDDCYARIASFPEKKFLLLVDSFKSVEKSLATKRVDILKVNIKEILQLAGRQGVTEAVKYCFDTFDLKYIALTAGPETAVCVNYSNGIGDICLQYLFCNNSEVYYEYKIPNLGSKLVNPIGISLFFYIN